MFGTSSIRQPVASVRSRLCGLLESFLYPSLHRFGLWLVEMTACSVTTHGVKEQEVDEREVDEVVIADTDVHPPSLELDFDHATPIPVESQELDAVEPAVKPHAVEVVLELEQESPEEPSSESCAVQVDVVLSDCQNAEGIEDKNTEEKKNDDRLVTIVAVCNVLEVLERQLSDVSQDVETSVAGVCKGFQGMAMRAQAAVNAAAESLGSGVKDDIGKDLISEMQKVLSSLIENVRASSDFTQTVSGKLLSLESRLAAIENTLGSVETLANKAKLVALNGQIEAARLGAAGQAFAVVAKETKMLSTHAAATSDSIRHLVGELSKEVKETSAEIRKRTEIDLGRFAQSEVQAKDLLNDIDVSHKRIMQSLNTTSQISGELRGDISKAVMSMQFQDRVSQCIAHVVETMEVLVDHVDPKSISDYELEAKDRSDRWLTDISKSYTMNSERVALGRDELVDSSGASAQDDFDVELF